MTAHGGHMTAHGGHMTAYGGHMTALMVLWYVKSCALDCREAQTSNCGRNIPKCVLQTSYFMRRYYMHTYTHAHTHTRTHTHTHTWCRACGANGVWPSGLLQVWSFLASFLPFALLSPVVAAVQTAPAQQACASLCVSLLLLLPPPSFAQWSPPLLHCFPTTTHTHPRSRLLQVWKGDMWSNLIYLRGSKTVRDMFTMKVEAIKKCVM